MASRGLFVAMFGAGDANAAVRSTRTIDVIQIEGLIDPPNAQLIVDAVHAANRDHSQILVITINRILASTRRRGTRFAAGGLLAIPLLMGSCEPACTPAAPGPTGPSSSWMWGGSAPSERRILEGASATGYASSREIRLR